METLLLVGLHLLLNGYRLPDHLYFARDFAWMLAKHNWIRLNPRVMTNSGAFDCVSSGQSLFIYSHLQRFTVFCGSCLLGLLLVAYVSFSCL